jgi:RNA polymerase sigma-70 factor (TIGR02943 family)
MQDPKQTTAQLTNPLQWTVNYADYLYRYAITRINDEEQARDLVQETFLAALEKINAFEGKSSEKTWLTAILKNKIIDLYRKKSSGLNAKTEMLDQENFQQDFFHAEDGHWKEEHRPKEFIALQEEPMQQQEFNKVLQACMKKLPELWYAIFSMKHMDEESTEVICTVLKVTPSNFWVIIHRTKLSLRACLQKNWL